VRPGVKQLLSSLFILLRNEGRNWTCFMLTTSYKMCWQTSCFSVSLRGWHSDTEGHLLTWWRYSYTESIWMSGTPSSSQVGEGCWPLWRCLSQSLTHIREMATLGHPVLFMRRCRAWPWSHGPPHSLPDPLRYPSWPLFFTMRIITTSVQLWKPGLCKLSMAAFVPFWYQLMSVLI
jgi:hypothetical protein